MNPYLKSYLRAIALGPKRSPYLTRRFAAINLVVLLAWWALGRPGDQTRTGALLSRVGRWSSWRSWSPCRGFCDAGA